MNPKRKSFYAFHTHIGSRNFYVYDIVTAIFTMFQFCQQQINQALIFTRTLAPKTFIFSTFLCLSTLFASAKIFSQKVEETFPQRRKTLTEDNIPALVKNLPNWKVKYKEAIFITNAESLCEVLCAHPILEAIGFLGDAEAVMASYDQGSLLIVEYGTPQASVDTDKKVRQKLAELKELNLNTSVFYRRIGNYNVFLFDGKGEKAANALFNQIKYQKVIQWVSVDPFVRNRAEQNVIRQTSSLFIATVKVVLFGMGVAIVIGTFCGVILHRVRKRKRAAVETFSDGGGLTRLNLDLLTPEI